MDERPESFRRADIKSICRYIGRDIIHSLRVFQLFTLNINLLSPLLGNTLTWHDSGCNETGFVVFFKLCVPSYSKGGSDQ